MERLKRARPRPALIVAIVALVAALAGTAVAEEATTAVSKKQTKKIAKKQAKKQINKLAPGLSVAHADTAGTADSAAQVDTLQLDPVNVAKSAATLAAATEVELLTYGPFTVYGKCYGPAAETDGDVIIKTSDAGAVLESGQNDLDGDPAYLNPGTLENDRDLAEADAAANSADGDDDETFDAVLGNVKLQGTAAAFAKNGNPAAGNGTYGAGDRCIFDAYGTQEGA